MKRNTLMKRLAVAALAATMTVGMAVPAMAATGTVSGSKTNPAGQVVDTASVPQNLTVQEAAKHAEWFTLSSWNDTAKIKLNSNENDTTANFWLDNEGNVYTWKTLTSSSEWMARETFVGAVSNVSYAVGQYVYPEDVTPSLIDDGTVTRYHANKILNTQFNEAGELSTTTTTYNTGSLVPERIATKSGNESYVDKNTTNSWTGPSAAKVKLTSKTITTVNHVDGAAEVTVGDVNDDGYAVVWTIKNLNDNYFNTKVDKNTFELTPDKFGTTVYEYTGKLYHGGKYVGPTSGDVTGYFAVTMPLNKDTIKELVDKAVKNVVSTNGVNSAASDGTKAIKDYVDSKDPKVWEFQTLTNNAHTLDVDVNTVNEFHAATGFKAHVWVTDKDANGNKKITYDYGIKDFAFAKAAVKFTDVADTAYYAPSVYWGVEKGLVKGTSDTTFSPYNTLTREQLIVMLYRQAGSPAVAINEKFDDLTGLSDESKKAISWGVQNGIVNGTTEVKFSPKEAVNRAQVVTMLFRLAGSPKNYNETNFTDVAHGSYYEDAVDWAVNQKIVKGTSLTTFSPKADTTRAQGITLLDRYFNR